VWLNPPYGDQIGQWTRHLVEEYEAGNVDAALALLPARPDTQWFRPLFDYPRCWVFGRLHFTGAQESAPFPSVVVYLGPDVARFRAVFGTIGYVDVPVQVAEVAHAD
jgi:DNA-binding transcriptional LysR family regulator